MDRYVYIEFTIFFLFLSYPETILRSECPLFVCFDLLSSTSWFHQGGRAGGEGEGEGGL